MIVSKPEHAARGTREDRPVDGAASGLDERAGGAGGRTGEAAHGVGGRTGESARSGATAGEVDPDGQRKKLVWESALGFVGFFTLLAGVQAVWNVFQPEPSPWPGVFFAVLLLLSWLVWRRYRRYREY